MFLTETLSKAAMLVLQSAYASSDAPPRSPMEVLSTLGYGHGSEEDAVIELQAAGLLEPGDYEGTLRPTDQGWSFIEQAWPNGQLPIAGGTVPTVVIGSFDCNHDLPTRLAHSVADLNAVIPLHSPFARAVADQGLRYSVWRLLWPLTGEPADRILVRIDEGRGSVVEWTDTPADGFEASIGPGTWLSVDLDGQFRESRQSLEEIVFLIAMDAA